MESATYDISLVHFAPYARVNGSGSKGQVLPSQHIRVPLQIHLIILSVINLAEKYNAQF